MTWGKRKNRVPRDGIPICQDCGEPIFTAHTLRAKYCQRCRGRHTGGYGQDSRDNYRKKRAISSPGEFWALERWAEEERTGVLDLEGGV